MMNDKDSELRIIEFFSGIGGLLLSVERAVKESNNKVPNFKIVSAYDINTFANETYSLNHHHKPKNKAIDRLKQSDLPQCCNFWLLSPPCQPFTHGGNKKDHLDPRTKPLLNLLDVLRNHTVPPTFIFLENVKGFETSIAHKILMNTLQSKNYQIEEFIVSPSQLGIPNTRVRYYCLAWINSKSQFTYKFQLNFVPPLHPFLLSQGPTSKNCIGNYLETLEAYNLPLYIIPSVKLEKFSNFLFDIVNKDHTASTTITKGYGRFLGKSGPLLDLSEDSNKLNFQMEPVDPDPKLHIYDTSKLDPTRFRHIDPSEKTRYLTPKELLRLHGFPNNFVFPSSLSDHQKYSLIGNSIRLLSKKFY